MKDFLTLSGWEAALIGLLLLLIIFYRSQIRGKDKLIADLRVLSTTDPLTGLLNRRPFLDELERHLGKLPIRGDLRHTSSVASVAFFFIDFDHFKQINDTYGHRTGDRVLKRAARAVRCALRDTDTVCRYGGEEFAALLEDVTAAEAKEVAEKVRRAVEDLQFNQSGLQVTASVGVVCVQQKVSAGRLIETADTAAYDAKDAGRNQVVMRQVTIADQGR